MGVTYTWVLPTLKQLGYQCQTAKSDSICSASTPFLTEEIFALSYLNGFMSRGQQLGLDPDKLSCYLAQQKPGVIMRCGSSNHDEGRALVVSREGTKVCDTNLGPAQVHGYSST